MIDGPIQLDDEIIPPEEEDTGEGEGGEEGGQEDQSNQQDNQRSPKKRRRDRRDRSKKEDTVKSDRKPGEEGAQGKLARGNEVEQSKTAIAGAVPEKDKKLSDSSIAPPIQKPIKPTGPQSEAIRESKPTTSGTSLAAGAGKSNVATGIGDTIEETAGEIPVLGTILGVKRLYDQAKDLAQTSGQIAKEIKNLPRTTARTARKGISRAGRWAKDPGKALRAMGRTARMNLSGKNIGKGASAVGSAAGSVGEQAKSTARSVPGMLMGAAGGGSKDQQAMSQTMQAAHQLAVEATGAPKKIADTARTIYETPQRIRDTINAIKTAAKIAQQVAREAAKAAPKVVQAVVNVVRVMIAAWPVTLIILVIIIIVVIMMYLFGGGLSYISSLMGGSVFVPANPNNPTHVQIVANLEGKMTGCDPKLVVYSEGKGDIAWQTDENGNKYHLLDIRLLKTLDYLTDKHNHIMIGLLRTGSPKLMRMKNLIKVTGSKAVEAAWKEQMTKPEAEQEFLPVNIKQGTQGYEVSHVSESLSAYNTGQAMAILEIDRSQNPKVPTIKNSCGQTVPAPVEVAWQDTLSDESILTWGDNDEVRIAWEELAATAGFLDRNLATYVLLSTVSQSQTDQLINNIRAQLDSTPPESGREFDLYTETFVKIRRAIDIINKKILNRSDKDKVINQATLGWLIKAFAYFDSVDKSLAVDQDMLEGGRIATQTWEAAVAKFDSIGKTEWDRKIKSLGSDEIVGKLNAGVSAIYNALNAANMVGWNDVAAPLEKRKAFEARQKIRQVILELERMPNETYLEPPAADKITPEADAVHFDPNLVIKQLITYSPEDDLDNGQESIDIFPRGLILVDEDGTGFDFSLKDGEVGYADLHFSHSPIDNGVFSVRGAVFSFVTPKSFWSFIPTGLPTNPSDIAKIAVVIAGMSRIRDDSLGEIGHYMASTGPNGEQITSALDPTQLISKDLLTTIPVSFRKFIHVAF